VVSEGTRVHCGGSAVFYNRRFRCWKREGHGAVDLRAAIKHSCDVYFYTLGQRLGIERIAQYARRFGWGTPSGIDLAGEKAGLVPDEEWSQRVRKHKWYPGETISVSIGQGPLLVTPLQMATMMAAVANRGKLPTPYLAQPAAPHAVEGIAAGAWEPVREGLQAVMDSGSGYASRVPGLTVAGKTGTVQVVAQHTWVRSRDLPYEQRDHAWFVSFAPVEDPELVISVFVEHGGGGSAAAAPLAKALYETFLAKRPDLRRLPAV
jgi:penicillin-binding protein 2